MPLHSRRWWRIALWMLMVWLGLAPLSWLTVHSCDCYRPVRTHACCAPSPATDQASPAPHPRSDCPHCQLCQASHPNPAVLTGGTNLPDQSFTLLMPPLQAQVVVQPTRTPLYHPRLQPLIQTTFACWAPRAPPV